jgi:predicted permease
MTISGLLQDVRYALRGFRRSPGFVAVVVVSIGLGIAANSTIFTMVNKVLLGDLTVEEPQRLVSLVRDGGQTTSFPAFKDYQEQLGSVFSGVSAHFPLLPASVAGQGEPERVWGQVVSANYFDVVGAKIARGRGFLASEDDAVGRDAVVVLSDGLWKRQFGSDPVIVGKTILLSQQPYTVVGVAPPGFHGTDRMLTSEFWAPIAMTPALLPELNRDGKWKERTEDWLWLDARLKPGVTRQQALAALTTVQSRIDAQYKKKDEPKTKMAIQTSGTLPGEAQDVGRGVMAALMVVGFLVLLIACANVANILLARGTARQKEIGVRLAMGASRGRLISQLLTESVMLAVGGAAFGYVLSIWAAGALSRQQFSLPFPVDLNFQPDARVFLFTATLAAVAGIVFGLAPALRATKLDLVKAVHGLDIEVAGSRRFGLRNLLVVTQVALSLVLLIGSGLFLRSLQHASSIDLGMKPGNVLAMSFDPVHSRVNTGDLVSQVRERVGALPGVQSVGLVDVVPLSIGGASTALHKAGDTGKETTTDMFLVSTGFIDTMGMKLVRGHDFETGNRPGAKAAIVNETMVAKLFAGIDPIGQQLLSKRRTYEIIGVVKNAKLRTVGEEARPALFASLEQDSESVMSLFGVTLLVRTAGPPEAFAPAVKQEISTLAPGIALFNVETMQRHFEKAFILPRVSATLFGVFGGTGLALAMIGLYGVMSFSVRRRTREIGIRMALGAEKGTVLRMVARQGLTLTLVGLACGLPIALGLGRVTSSVLYGISPSDPVTFVAIPMLLLFVGLAASLVPARRAARVEPLVALRYE